MRRIYCAVTTPHKQKPCWTRWGATTLETSAIKATWGQGHSGSQQPSVSEWARRRYDTTGQAPRLQLITKFYSLMFPPILLPAVTFKLQERNLQDNCDQRVCRVTPFDRNGLPYWVSNRVTPTTQPNRNQEKTSLKVWQTFATRSQDGLHMHTRVCGCGGRAGEGGLPY